MKEKKAGWTRVKTFAHSKICLHSVSNIFFVLRFIKIRKQRCIRWAFQRRQNTFFFPPKWHCDVGVTQGTVAPSPQLNVKTEIYALVISSGEVYQQVGSKSESYRWQKKMTKLPRKNSPVLWSGILFSFSSYVLPLPIPSYFWIQFFECFAGCCSKIQFEGFSL